MLLILNLNDWFIVFKIQNLSCMFFNATQTTLASAGLYFTLVICPIEKGFVGTLKRGELMSKWLKHERMSLSILEE